MKTVNQPLQVNMLKTASYNRKLTDTHKHAKRIASNFNPQFLGTIEVSCRDGNYYIIDGQNRVLACRLRNLEMVDCKVHYGLTYEEEANLFYILNTDRFALKSAEKLNGLKEAKDPDILRLYAIVGINGFQISTSCGENKITAVAALQQTAKKYGLEVLDDALDIIRKSWGGDQQSLKGDIIQGMSMIVSSFGKDLKKARAIDKFSAIDPREVIRLADADPMGGMKKFKVARALLYYYNKMAKQKLDASKIK